MSAGLARTLVVQQQALVDALDGADPAAIEAATHALAETLGRLSANGGWRELPELLDQLREALRLAQAAAARVNFLGEQNRRRLEQVTARRGGPALGLAYGQRGWRAA